jgi:hypothetical protein
VDLQNIHVCYELAKEQPEHLDQGVPNAAAVKTAAQLPKPIEQAIVGTTNVIQDLNTFLLKPEGLK